MAIGRSYFNGVKTLKPPPSSRQAGSGQALLRGAFQPLQKFQFEIKQGQGDYQILPVEFFPEKIPFAVKRTYFIISSEQETKTGQHAHYKEEEVFLVIKGQADLISIDEKGQEYTIKLTAGEAVYIPKKIWHGFPKLEANTMIAAFSSTHHKADRSDYLEDKAKYLTKILNLNF